MAATTFIELVVTILLLTLFAAIAFPILWSSSRANAAHSLETTAQRARLTLATVLPRFTDEVRPPYWESPANVFQSSGAEWKAFYLDGKRGDYLVVRKDGASRLSLLTPGATFSIDNLPGLDVDWWKKDDRIIGVVVQWTQGGETVQFHASWGSFLL